MDRSEKENVRDTVCSISSGQLSYNLSGGGKLRWNKMNKKTRLIKKGSLTVEASFVIPLSVMVMALVLSLGFFLYQRCWYTQAACETVLAGSTRAILKGKSGEEEAKKRWDIMRKESPMPWNQITSAITGSGDRLEVHITGETPVWGRKSWKAGVTVSQKIVRPVTYIRKLEALQKG